MTEIHRRGAFYVTSDEPGVYRVWRDGEPPKLITVTFGRGAAQRAREECARCADPGDQA